MVKTFIDEAWLASARPAEILEEIRARDAQIANLNNRLETHLMAYGQDFPVEEEAWIAPFVSRFTLDDGKDGEPVIQIVLYQCSGTELRWLVQIGNQLLNKHGDLEDHDWLLSPQQKPLSQDDIERLTGSLAESYGRTVTWNRDCGDNGF